MNTGEQAYEQLIRANPIADTTQFQPARSEAIAFTERIEGKAMGIETTVRQPTLSQVSASRIAIAVVSFLVVVALGAVAWVVASSGNPDAVATTPNTAPPRAVEEPVDEPEQLAQVREAVNAGDAATAASVHGEEGDCDRFFTTGPETCEDWYSFLVGLSTNISTAACTGGINDVACEWTISSDLHLALGIDSVTWGFTSVGIDGWSTAVPDGNLLTGTMGLAALDADFWEFITAELEDDPSAAAERVSARVPATLDADFASFVLEAAAMWDEAP